MDSTASFRVFSHLSVLCSIWLSGLIIWNPEVIKISLKPVGRPNQILSDKEQIPLKLVQIMETYPSVEAKKRAVAQAQMWLVELAAPHARGNTQLHVA